MGLTTRASAVGFVTLLFSIGLVAATWRSEDGRLVLGAVVLTGLLGAAWTWYVWRVAGVRWVRGVALAALLVCLLGAATGTAYLSGNWQYLRGRALMASGDYEGAVECYEQSIGLLARSGVTLIGPPFRWRLTSQGVSQDRRVEMFADLGYISLLAEDSSTATGWYNRALVVAREQGYGSETIANLQGALAASRRPDQGR